MNPFTRALGGVNNCALAAVASVAAFAVPATSHAADSAATGIDGSFTTMLGDLTGMLDGNFGALILLVSLIIAVGVYAVTSNWKFVIASLMVAFLIGYGVDIIQGIGGVTAMIDMVGTDVFASADATAGAVLPQ